MAINSCSLIESFYFGCQEATAIGKTFASMKDYQFDGNREMMALGTMNVVGSMTSCYVATGKLKDNVYESNYLSSTASLRNLQ